MRNTIFIVLFSVILVSGSVVPSTFAEHLSAGSGIGAGLGGVNHPGAWYAGENLKVGDYFKYKVCHNSLQGLYRFLAFNVGRKGSD